MTTNHDAARTEWSLPVQDDMPRDTLQVQLEGYQETVLLRGFEADRSWVRTVSADEIANVFTRRPGRARFRVYGVVGRLDTPAPELALRVGIYGHFAPLQWPRVFDGP